jgi:hypothetical protein
MRRTFARISRRQHREAYYERRASGSYTIWLWFEGQYHKVSTCTDRHVARDICDLIGKLNPAERLSVIRETTRHTRVVLGLPPL